MKGKTCIALLNTRVRGARLPYIGLSLLTPYGLSGEQTTDRERSGFWLIGLEKSARATAFADQNARSRLYVVTTSFGLNNFCAAT